MSILVIKLEVNEVDPTTQDPEEVADFVLDPEFQMAGQNARFKGDFLSAEWER